MNIKKSVFFATLIINALAAMDTEPPALIARPKIQKGPPSLMDLATASIIEAFRFDNPCSIERLKDIALQASKLPEELKKLTMSTMLEQMADDLEGINYAQPIKLSYGVGACAIISPDSKFICFPDYNGPHDALVLVDLSTSWQKIIDVDELEHKKFIGGLSFTPDSNSIVFDRKNQKYTTIYRYHIPTESLSHLADVPFADASEYLLTPDGKKLIFAAHPYFENEKETTIMDVETKSFKSICGLFPFLSPSDLLITRTRDNKALCYQLDGTLLFELPCVLSRANFDTHGDHVATVVDKTVCIWNAQSGELVREIIFPDRVDTVSFVSQSDLFVKTVAYQTYTLLRTNVMTGEYTLLGHNVPFASECMESKDKLLRVQSYSLKGDGDESFTLFHALMQKPVRYYTDTNLGLRPILLSGDGSLIIAAGKDLLPYLLTTHRAITNRASLEDILRLLILEKQLRNKQPLDSSIISQSQASPSDRLREIVEERYLQQPQSLEMFMLLGNTW